jgi:hypothetical protein
MKQATAIITLNRKGKRWRKTSEVRRIIKITTSCGKIPDDERIQTAKVKGMRKYLR